MKRRIQHAVERLHRGILQRPMPPKASVYLHSVTDGEERLDELLGFLADQGYSFVGPGEFAGADGKVAFISFDDNYRSWLRALPILDRHRARATFYVNSWPFRDRVGAAEVQQYLRSIVAEGEATLSTAELREIAAAGHVVGAHTHTHPMLTRLPRQRAQDEIRISKEELEAVLQRPVRHFSYPFGMRRHFSPSLRAYCRSIGFETIANGIPCMQFARSRPDGLHRSVWFLEQPLIRNLANLCIDGRLFHAVTGRSAVGAGLS